MRIVLSLIVAIVAIGAAGITTAILSSEPADAKSRNRQIATCHGCTVGSQGAESSEGKCVHN